MAIPEACSVWIEQRVQEELDAKKDTGASLREIGRTVAAEVEKYFETKVNPDTIRKKAERIEHGTNVPSAENPVTTGVEGGVQGGTEITPKETTSMVEEKIQDGKSKKQARREVAQETGLKENSVKVAHQRSEKKKAEQRHDQDVEPKECHVCGSVYPGDHEHCDGGNPPP